MLNVLLTILALVVACLIVWVAVRRSRVVQRVSGNLSGPVEQMQEQILLTADTAIDRLDSKIAQMEILLAEIDRRSNLLAQQSQQNQLRQLQLEQQQQQMTDWIQKLRQQTEQEFAVQKQSLTQHQQQSAVLENPAPMRAATTIVRTQTTTQSKMPVKEFLPEIPRQIQEAVSAPVISTVVKPAKTATQAKPLVMDKRTTILEMAEQGWSVTDIAQKMGIGKGEVMLLLKLRKKSVE
jgi:hypothetical protein